MRMEDTSTVQSEYKLKTTLMAIECDGNHGREIPVTVKALTKCGAPIRTQSDVRESVGLLDPATCLTCGPTFASAGR